MASEPDTEEENGRNCNKKSINLGQRFEPDSLTRVLPIPREHFYPAKPFYFTTAVDPDSLIHTVLRYNFEFERSTIVLASSFSEIQCDKLVVERGADKTARAFKHITEPRWLQKIRQKTTKPPLEKRRGRKKKVRANPLMIDLEYRNNKFLFGKALLHPRLGFLTFHEAAITVASLWNDYDNFNACDYFTLLTLCTSLQPSRAFSMPLFIHLNDFLEFRYAYASFEDFVKVMILLADVPTYMKKNPKKKIQKPRAPSRDMFSMVFSF